MVPTTTTQKTGANHPDGAPGNNNQNQAPMLSLAETKQKEIAETVIQLFKDAQEQNPELSYHKLTVLVAAQTGYSPEGIKKMLNRNGITNPQKRS